VERSGFSLQIGATNIGGGSGTSSGASSGMSGWGKSKNKGQGVEVARRNLRMHQRNHSWGGLQSMAHDQQLDDAEAMSSALSKESPLLASHISPSSPPELHWFEANETMGGVMNIMSPKGGEEPLIHSIMMVRFPFVGSGDGWGRERDWERDKERGLVGVEVRAR